LTGNGTDWQSANTFVVSPEQTASYTLYAKTSAGCTATAENATTVTVNPLPTGFTLSSATICADGLATLTVTQEETGVVTPAVYSLTGNNWQEETTFEVNPGATTVYPLYAKTAAGCSATGAAAGTVTVNQLPEPPVISDVDRCGTGDVTLTACTSSGEPLTYTWIVGGDAPLTNANGTLTVPSMNQSTTYSVMATNAAGCNSMVQTAAITIRSAPTLVSRSGKDVTYVSTGIDGTHLIYDTYNVTEVTVEGLPAGLTGELSGTTFAISGITDSLGVYEYTVTANDVLCDVSVQASGAIQTLANFVILDPVASWWSAVYECSKLGEGWQLPEIGKHKFATYCPPLMEHARYDGYVTVWYRRYDSTARCSSTKVSCDFTCYWDPYYLIYDVDYDRGYNSAVERWTLCVQWAG
jgi:hypothetical protein